MKKVISRWWCHSCPNNWNQITMMSSKISRLQKKLAVLILALQTSSAPWCQTSESAVLREFLVLAHFLDSHCPSANSSRKGALFFRSVKCKLPSWDLCRSARVLEFKATLQFPQGLCEFSSHLFPMTHSTLFLNFWYLFNADSLLAFQTFKC